MGDPRNPAGDKRGQAEGRPPLRSATSWPIRMIIGGECAKRAHETLILPIEGANRPTPAMEGCWPFPAVPPPLNVQEPVRRRPAPSACAPGPPNPHLRGGWEPPQERPELFPPRHRTPSRP